MIKKIYHGEPGDAVKVILPSGKARPLLTRANCAAIRLSETVRALLAPFCPAQALPAVGGVMAAPARQTWRLSTECDASCATCWASGRGDAAMTDEYISDDGPGSGLFDPYETGWWKSVSSDKSAPADQPYPNCYGEGNVVVRV